MCSLTLKAAGRRLPESSAAREGKPHVRFEAAGNGNQAHKAHAPFPDPTTRTPRGTGGWILTAKLALFLASGFVRFAGEFTPPGGLSLSKRCRNQPPGLSPDGDDVPLRFTAGMISRAVGCGYAPEFVIWSHLVFYKKFDEEHS